VALAITIEVLAAHCTVPVRYAACAIWNRRKADREFSRAFLDVPLDPDLGLSELMRDIVR
jgi:hypothetical protein